MRKLLALALACAMSIPAAAQGNFERSFNQIDEGGNITQRSGRVSPDSLGSDKEIPMGMHVWTVDERFGDRTTAEIDTMPHMFQNNMFTTGLRGEYNTTGNLGAPRIARIAIDRAEPAQFIFTQPYDFFVRPVGTHRFTNTYSPITNITYNTAGDRTNGEDYFRALYAVNAGKRIGAGFRFDYLYGRGYYDSQSTSHFGYTMWGSYLGDRYEAHLLFSTNHQKVTENGGITSDEYITHPESFSEDFQTSEIPTVLERNWNRNDNQHIFFSHRYNVGFNRKVPMTEEEIKARKFAIESKKQNDAAKQKEEEEKRARKEGRDFDEEEYDRRLTPSGRPEGATIAGDESSLVQEAKADTGRIAVSGKAMADSLLQTHQQAEADTSWLKDEYVPVTSFIHTLKFDNYKRIYQAYETPDGYYLNNYFDAGKLTGDSIYDRTRFYHIRNTVAIALLEGFNKWAKAGLKAFASYDLRHFELPDNMGGIEKYSEHDFSVGGTLSKSQGSMLHYNVTGEFGLMGQDAGFMKLDGRADLNFAFLGDTVQLATNAFIHRTSPTFYFRHYHARHYWWDNNDLDKVLHSRIEGSFTLKRTHTRLRVAYDNLQNYTYMVQSYDRVASGNDFLMKNNEVAVRQNGGNMSLITAQLCQDFHVKFIHWENVLTYQKSSNEDVLPVPDFNIYSNLYLKFKIARVLSTEFGADVRYFTKYYAPDYSPALGQYTVQGNGENQRTQVGNYPLANVYLNFHLKHTRFFVMFSHVNCGSGKRDYFFTPHYPLNERILRFGVSWNFFN